MSKVNPIEKFNALDPKLRNAVFMVVVLLFIGLDYLLIVQFQISNLTKMRAEIKQLGDDTARVKIDQQRIHDIKKGVEDQRGQLRALDNRVRPLQEVPAVLADMSRLANETGVKIDQLLPSKDGQEMLVETDDAKYYALPIAVTAHSGYHMFGHFLNKLESGNILVMVRDLRIEGNDKDAANLSIQATLKVVLVEHKTPEKKK